jgi:small subunit ribosomal protein S16
MITIRLTRVGKKNDPSFRVIVVDSKKKPKTGNYLEMVGSYDPRQDRVELKGERILEWIKNGATTSGTVHNLLVSNKIIEGKKRNVLPKKTVAKIAEPTATPAAAAVAPVVAESVETPVEQGVESSVAGEEAAS